MTALTVNGSAAAATTLAAAGKMFNATGGSSGNTSTKISAFASGTNFKQIFALGTTTAQGNGVTSIPAPTDSNWHGWMWDVTTLEGQNMLGGTWTPTFHLLASTGTTVTPTVQWFKRSSAGSYTSIGSVAGSSIALTTSAQLLIFTPPSLSAMAFATGDKLVMWLWVNQTAGGATNSTISVVEATSASSAGVTSEAQAATPGYLPTTVTKSAGMRMPVRTQGTKSAGVRTRVRTPGPSTGVYAATVLADKPRRYYHLNELSGATVTDSGTQGQNGTLTGSGVTQGQAGVLSGESDTCYVWSGLSDGYVACPDAGITSGPFTLEAWVNLAGAGTIGATGNADILAIGSFGPARVMMNTGGGTAGSFTTEQGGTYTTTSQYTYNARHHVILTWNGTVESFWIDGVQDSTFTPSSTPTWSGAFQIGSDIGNYCWNGRIDEVAIYGYALTATQIANHYTQGTAPNKALGYPLRVPVRTTVTKSLGLRVLSRTQKTVSTALRTVIRTQKTVSTGMRAVIRGITKVTPLRMPIRTQQAKSASLRTRVRTQISDTTVVRALIRTQHSVSTNLRTLIRTLVTKSAVLRALVRTQRTLSTNVRAVVRTQLAKSTALRAVIRGITKVAQLRVRVRTQRTGSTSLRTAIRTQATTKALLRTLVRTTRSLSTPLRTLIRSQHSLTTALRTVVSIGVNLATKSSVLRLRICTLKGFSTMLRVSVRSQATKSTVLRMVIRGISRVMGLRVLVRTRRTTNTAMRMVLRTKQSLITALRTRVGTQGSAVVQLRAIIRGRTLLVAMRTRVRSQASRLLVLRVRVANNRMNTWLMLIRMPVRSQHTASAALRIVCIQPNAVVLVRSGQGEFRVRGGQATVLVRSGEAELLVRSGQATVLVEEE